MNAGFQNKEALFRIIFRTGLLVGSLDIASAFIYNYLRSGVHPTIVLQFIASGVLGRKSFSGGMPAALLGLLFHYCIAFIWTFLFFVIYPKVKMSPRHKILAGLGYGMLIWVVMNLVVLPLSMTPKMPFQMSQFLFEIAFLMFLIGLPISLIYHKHYSRLLLHQ